MSQQHPRLVALGDVLLDVVIRPGAAIKRGTDVPGTLSFRRGGSAANTTATFVELGGRAALITSLGDDHWADQLSASLRAAGVRVHALRRAGVSGRLAAIVDERGERSFVTERGAADKLLATDIKPAWLRDGDVLHVPAYSIFHEPIGNASVRASELARAASLLVSTDLSSAGPLLAFGVRRARKRITELAPDILFANRDEAAVLLGRPGRRAWTGLLSHARLVVVKDGARGCRVLVRGSDGSVGCQLDVAATRVSAADTTGAGDAFAAGFLYSLTRSGGHAVMEHEPTLRQAAMDGHRTAGELLRRHRPELRLVRASRS